MTPLAAEVEALFDRQVSAWPLLARGVAGLAGARTKTVDASGFEVLVRHIPHRVASTTAPVDAASIAKRPCFLCRQNMPAEEEGLPFGAELTIYANPFPILERHLTVVHRDHRPQRLDAALEAMLDLAAGLPDFAVVYNGPECGASAPDHLHLQAGRRDGLPLARDVEGMCGPVVSGYGWTALVFRGARANVLADARRALSALAARTDKRPEPLVNVALLADGGDAFTLVLFPRSRHRPEAFHRGELLVSPATIDMSGILVTPREEDFERLDGPRVRGVFREVSLPDDAVARLAAELAS
jgi:hypothetical protein